MKGILGEKRSNVGKTKPRPQGSPLTHVPAEEKQFGSHWSLIPLPKPLQAKASLRRARQGLFQKPLSHAGKQLRGQGRPHGRRPPLDPRPRSAPQRGGGEPGGAASRGRGRGRRHGLFVSPGRSAHAGRRRRGWPGRTRGRPGVPTPGSRTPGIHCSPPARAREPGARGARPRATTTGWRLRLCAAWAAGGRAPSPRTPPPAARSGFAGGPRRSGPPTPKPAPLTWGQERRSRARADAGAVGPGRGLREERAGRLGAAAAGRERVGAAGGGGAAAAAAGSSFVPAAAPSVAGTRRSSGSGRREAGGGAEEEAEGGPQAARLTLLAALARRHLTPPPAAGRADSEGERPVRCEAWAPRGPADGALRRFCYRRGSCAALRSERSPSRDAHGSALQPTDALSPPGAWAVRERGGQGAESVRQRKPRRRRRTARWRHASDAPPPAPVPIREARWGLLALLSRGAESPTRLPAPGWSWKERVLWRMRFYFYPIVRPLPPAFRFSHSSPLLAIWVLTLCLKSSADVSLSSLVPQPPAPLLQN